MSNVLDKVKRKVKSARRRARSRVSSLREKITGGEATGVLDTIRERVQEVRGGRTGGTGTSGRGLRKESEINKSERRGM